MIQKISTIDDSMGNKTSKNKGCDLVDDCLIQILRCSEYFDNEGYDLELRLVNQQWNRVFCLSAKTRVKLIKSRLNMRHEILNQILTNNIYSDYNQMDKLMFLEKDRCQLMMIAIITNQKSVENSHKYYGTKERLFIIVENWRRFNYDASWMNNLITNVFEILIHILMTAKPRYFLFDVIQKISSILSDCFNKNQQLLSTSIMNKTGNSHFDNNHLKNFTIFYEVHKESKYVCSIEEIHSKFNDNLDFFANRFLIQLWISMREFRSIPFITENIYVYYRLQSFGSTNPSGVYRCPLKNIPFSDDVSVVVPPRSPHDDDDDKCVLRPRMTEEVRLLESASP